MENTINFVKWIVVDINTDIIPQWLHLEVLMNTYQQTWYWLEIKIFDNSDPYKKSFWKQVLFISADELNDISIMLNDNNIDQDKLELDILESINYALYKLNYNI